MGAVPVVLKKHLGRSLWEGMPILAVDNYEEFVGRSDDELRKLYRELAVRRPDKAFVAGWVSEFS